MRHPSTMPLLALCLALPLFACGEEEDGDSVLSSSIDLTLLNMSNEGSDHLPITIYEPNVSDDDASNEIYAHRVVQHLEQGGEQPMPWIVDAAFSVTDPQGGETARQRAVPGTSYELVFDGTDYVIEAFEDGAGDYAGVEFTNSLEDGSISVTIYRDSRPLVREPELDPGETEEFSFMPSFFIGLVDGAIEGVPLTEDQQGGEFTKLDLIGIIGADVVMRGGGPASADDPVTFTLENVVY